MNHDIDGFERLVDQSGRPMTWRGKWLFADSALRTAGERVVEPVTFSRRYFKDAVIRQAIAR